MNITKAALIGVVGVVIGAGAILGFRYVTYKPDNVHYHANFDVYINGQKEAFKSPSYYEEESAGSCNVDTVMVPEERAHMHDDTSDVVHVHDHAVTWGQFFANLHWVVNDALIKTPSNLYLVDDTHKITFTVNGQKIQDISNQVIGDRDRLLVDFGDTSDATIQKEIKAVPATAVKYDEGKDPASCQAGAAPTVQERLKHLF